MKTGMKHLITLAMFLFSLAAVAAPVSPISVNGPAVLESVFKDGLGNRIAFFDRSADNGGRTIFWARAGGSVWEELFLTDQGGDHWEHRFSVWVPNATDLARRAALTVEERNWLIVKVGGRRSIYKKAGWFETVNLTRKIERGEIHLESIPPGRRELFYVAHIQYSDYHMILDRPAFREGGVRLLMGRPRRMGVEKLESVDQTQDGSSIYRATEGRGFLVSRDPQAAGDFFYRHALDKKGLEVDRVLTVPPQYLIDLKVDVTPYSYEFRGDLAADADCDPVKHLTSRR